MDMQREPSREPSAPGPYPAPPPYPGPPHPAPPGYPPVPTEPPLYQYPTDALPVGTYPAPPPEPPSQDRQASAGFTTVVAVVITVVSILIAVSAWRTTDAANRASDLDSLAIQQVAQRQQELEGLNGMVDLDLRLYARFQAYELAANAFDKAAKAVADQTSGEAQRLVVDAQGQRALARVLRQFFRGAIPSVDDAGIATYDPAFVLRNLVAGSSRLADLQPDVTQKRADVAHEQTAAFVLLVILFAGCLLVLTVAQVVHSRLRITLAVAGAGVAACGAVMLFLVETTLFPVA